MWHFLHVLPSSRSAFSLPSPAADCEHCSSPLTTVTCSACRNQTNALNTAQTQTTHAQNLASRSLQIPATHRTDTQTHIYQFRHTQTHWCIHTTDAHTNWSVYFGPVLLCWLVFGSKQQTNITKQVNLKQINIVHLTFHHLTVVHLSAVL